VPRCSVSLGHTTAKSQDQHLTGTTSLPNSMSSQLGCLPRWAVTHFPVVSKNWCPSAILPEHHRPGETRARGGASPEFELHLLAQSRSLHMTDKEHTVSHAFSHLGLGVKLLEQQKIPHLGEEAGAGGKQILAC
jgi:hypothetical protein